jgi:uncharacterized membrane protein HdeD (DUF308 family)
MHRTGIRVILSVRDDIVSPHRKRECIVIVLGVILLILGLVLDISILYTIGVILLIIGVVLWILGATGRAVGGRPHYW